MRLDDLELLRLEPPRLEQDRVGDGDLAEVVQRRGLADEPDHPVALPQVARHPRGERRHALRVLGRVVVAVLRGEREPAAACRRGSPRRRGTPTGPGPRRSPRARRGGATSRGARAPAASAARPRDRAPRRPSARSATATTGGAAPSPSGSSRSRTASASMSPRLSTTCGLGGRRLGRHELQRGHQIDRRAARRAQLGAKGLGILAVPADNQDTGAGEDVVIHTET